MKKVLLGILTFSLFLSVSCSKEDSESRTFFAENLIGLWEQNGGDCFTACELGDNAKIEINNSEFRKYFTNEQGCLTLGYLAINYEFDGKVIYSMDGLITYKVIEANANTLTLNDGKNTYTYVKLN